MSPAPPVGSLPPLPQGAFFPGTIPRIPGLPPSQPNSPGKTTVASLLERFYDPTAGVVMLDGRDLRTLDPSWLRGQVVGFISQVRGHMGSPWLPLPVLPWALPLLVLRCLFFSFHPHHPCCSQETPGLLHMSSAVVWMTHPCPSSSHSSAWSPRAGTLCPHLQQSTQMGNPWDSRKSYSIQV